MPSLRGGAQMGPSNQSGWKTKRSERCGEGKEEVKKENDALTQGGRPKVLSSQSRWKTESSVVSQVEHASQGEAAGEHASCQSWKRGWRRWRRGHP